jgi:hypothetical protein
VVPVTQGNMTGATSGAGTTYGCIQSFLVSSYLVGMLLLWMHTKFSCVLLLGGNVTIMDAYKVFLCSLPWWECSYYGCIQSFLVLLPGGDVPIMDAYKVFLFSYLVVMFLLWMHTKFSCFLLLGGNVPIMDAYKVFLCSLTWW